MPERDTFIYNFIDALHAKAFYLYLKDMIKEVPFSGIHAFRLRGSAVSVESVRELRYALLCQLDSDANECGGVRDEGAGGAPVAAGEHPFPPRGPKVLKAVARP